MFFIGYQGVSNASCLDVDVTNSIAKKMLTNVTTAATKCDCCIIIVPMVPFLKKNL
ncbi:hypothetical protein LINPERHAP2_LOCUS34534 [Linum perenne]